MGYEKQETRQSVSSPINVQLSFVIYTPILYRQNYFMFMDMTGDNHELRVFHLACDADGTPNRVNLDNHRIKKFDGTLEELQENPRAFTLPDIQVEVEIGADA